MMKLSFINYTSRHQVRFALASGIVALGAVATGSIARAQTGTVYTYSTTAVSTAWLTTANWPTPGSHYPGVANTVAAAGGANTDIANFGVVAVTSVGINMNTTGAGLTLGGIDWLSTFSKTVFTLFDSSSTVPGVLTLNGSTINSVVGTILSNDSAGNIAVSGTSTGVLGVGLGSASSVIQDNGTGNLIISSIISGSGKNLSFQSGYNGAGTAGILTLSGVNTFSGSFTATSGTTSLSVPGALGSVTAVNVASGALLTTTSTGLTGTINSAAAVTLNGNLDVSGGTETVASVAGTSTGAFLTIGKNAAANGSFTVGDSTSTSFAGVVRDGTTGAGTTTFVKKGTGTLTLSNANTYTGSTSITAGKLLYTTATGSGTGASAVSIGTAGALASGAGTTGALTGLVTTAGTGSVIAPGATASANTGTVGALTLSGGLNIAAGAAIPFDLAATSATSDLIKITGGTFTGGTNASSVTFNFNNLGATNGTVYALINYSGATTVTSVDLTDFAATGVTGSFSFNGSELDFTAVVPEPTTILGGLLMVGAAGWSQRRRLRGLAGSMRTRRVA